MEVKGKVAHSSLRQKLEVKRKVRKNLIPLVPLQHSSREKTQEKELRTTHRLPRRDRLYVKGTSEGCDGEKNDGPESQRMATCKQHSLNIKGTMCLDLDLDLYSLLTLSSGTFPAGVGCCVSRVLLWQKVQTRQH